MHKNLFILLALVVALSAVGSYRSRDLSRDTVYSTGDFFKIEEMQIDEIEAEQAEKTSVKQNTSEQKIETVQVEKQDADEQKNTALNFGRVCGRTMTTPGAAGFGEAPAPYSTKVVALADGKPVGEAVSGADGYYEMPLAFGAYVIREEKYGTSRTIQISKPECTNFDIIVGMPSQYNTNPE